MEDPPQISHVTHVHDTVSSFGLLISYFWFMAGRPMSVLSKCCVLLRKLRFHCWRWFVLQTELTSLQKFSLGHRRKRWLFKLVFVCSVQTPSPLLPFHLSLLAKKILKHSEAITACLFWCLASFTAAIRFIVKPQPDLQRDVGATLPVPAVLWKTLFFSTFVLILIFQSGKGSEVYGMPHTWYMGVSHEHLRVVHYTIGQMIISL